MIIHAIRTNERMAALKQSLHSLGVTEESFLFWAKESMDAKYIESLPYYKLLVLSASLTTHLPISDELARVIIDSGCSLRANLWGRSGKLHNNLKAVNYSESKKHVFNDTKNHYLLVL